MEKKNTNIYVISIVAIVAIVVMISLTNNSIQSEDVLVDNNIGGKAFNNNYKEKNENLRDNEIIVTNNVEEEASFPFIQSGNFDENFLTDLDYVGNNEFLLITDRNPANKRGGYVWRLSYDDFPDRTMLNIYNGGYSNNGRDEGLTKAFCNSEICSFASADPVSDDQPFVHFQYNFDNSDLLKMVQGTDYPHMSNPFLFGNYIISYSNHRFTRGNSVILIDDYTIPGDGSLNVLFYPNSSINSVFKFQNKVYAYGSNATSNCMIQPFSIINDEGSLILDEVISLMPVQISNKLLCKFPNIEIFPAFNVNIDYKGYFYFNSLDNSLYRTDDFINFQQIPYFNHSNNDDRFLKGLYKFNNVMFAVTVNSNIGEGEIGHKVSIHSSNNGIDWSKLASIEKGSSASWLYKTLIARPANLPLTKKDSKLFIAIPIAIDPNNNLDHVIKIFSIPFTSAFLKETKTNNTIQQIR